MKKKTIKYTLVLILILIVANFLAANYFTRFDLTDDQRYTLSEESRDVLEKADSPVIVTVYLAGDFPSEFKRLQRETRYLLEEFSVINSAVKFEFKNPLEDGEDPQKIGEEFYRSGMSPENVSTYQNGKTSKQLIFPWAVARYKDQTVKIPLLQKNIQQKTEATITNSVAQLEYAFTDGFFKLLQEKSKKIAVMRGNGELPDGNLASFIKSGSDYYNFAPFTLDSVETAPQQTLKNLQRYDLIVEAKPTEDYTEDEKYLLDQYAMNGGKMLWLMDAVAAEKDSLFASQKQTTLAFPKMLNLTDFFFKYGLRINPSLVKDFKSAPLVLSRGRGKNAQMSPQPWFYRPLAKSKSDNPIVKNIEAVRFDFASPIDTLANAVDKTVLLTSSPRSKVLGAPRQINLSDIRQKPDFKTFNDGEQALAVLLEGEFTSAYANRVKPFSIQNKRKKSSQTKMLVVSDGDVIKNELNKGKPQELGFDRYTGKNYGNKSFLLNSLNYLLGDEALLALRSKEVKLHFLNTEKVTADNLKWKLINIGAPLIVLALFGILFRFWRRHKYIK